MGFYSFQASQAGPARLLLDGAIISSGWAFPGDVAAQRFCRELQACGDVEVIINSPGGDVFAGAEIYSLLKAHPGRVTVKIAGIAGSIASEIAMAGDEVLISPAGYIMIHQPWMQAVGDAKEFDQAARQLREVAQGIVNAYRAKTGMEESRIRELMDDETYMNARSAIEMGFADGLWEFDREAYRPGPANSMAGKTYEAGAILNRAREISEILPQNEKPEGGSAKPQAIADLKKKRLALAALAAGE